MKRIILTLAVCVFTSTAVFAYGGKGAQPIGDTPCRYNFDTKKISYVNEKGRTVAKGPYIWVEQAGNGIVAADADSKLRGMLDTELNIVIPMQYDFIEYNENNNSYKAVSKEKDLVDFYDGNFKRVSQPLDIFPLENTDHYASRVIYGTDSSESLLYICDEEGNRLIEEGFRYIDPHPSCIVVINENHEAGVFNSALEMAIPYGTYDHIMFYDGKLRCVNDTGYEPDVTYLSPYFKEIDVEKEIKPIFGDYFYQKHDDGLYYICDANGNVLKNKGYCEIDSIEGKIRVRSSDKYPKLYGLLDEDLNEVFDEKYFLTSYNSEKGIYTVYLNGSIEKYNNDKKIIETCEGYDFITPVKGMEGILLYETLPANKGPEESMYIIDDKGNMLSEHGFISITDEAQPGNTLIGRGAMGETVIGPDMKNIMREQPGNMYVREENGTLYIENIWDGNPTLYYDLYGNPYTTKEGAIAAARSEGAPSKHAEEKITEAIEAGIVPTQICSEYRKRITRQEFCRLAVMTYEAKTGLSLEKGGESPFKDINDDYVTAACSIGIMKGRGSTKFEPQSDITRREAALTLSSMLRLMSGEENKTASEEDDIFMAKAKEYITNAASLKSGDEYIAPPKDSDGFSSNLYLTREQAIMIMLDFYNK